MASFWVLATLATLANYLFIHLRERRMDVEDLKVLTHRITYTQCCAEWAGLISKYKRQCSACSAYKDYSSCLFKKTEDLCGSQSGYVHFENVRYFIGEVRRKHDKICRPSEYQRLQLFFFFMEEFQRNENFYLQSSTSVISRSCLMFWVSAADSSFKMNLPIRAISPILPRPLTLASKPPQIITNRLRK